MGAYLVTGGCGFIGSHLCEALVRRGDTVRILDDLSTGLRENAPERSQLIEASVVDPHAVDAAMEGMDGCFHLAAIASIERCKGDWLGAHRTNLSGTIAVLDAARRMGSVPIPVVYASTAAVYGDDGVLPTPETVEARPRSAYGADKLGSELHARVAREVYGVPTLGLRFFNVYGPRQDPASPYSGVISIFCDRVPRGETIEIFGDGRQTRDFVFVEDVVAASLAAMGMADRNSAPAVLNICSGFATSILDLAHLIGKLCGREPRIRLRPPRRGEILHSLGDPRLARRYLGLEEPEDLRSGLSATLSSLQASEAKS